MLLLLLSACPPPVTFNTAEFPLDPRQPILPAEASPAWSCGLDGPAALDPAQGLLYTQEDGWILEVPAPGWSGEWGRLSVYSFSEELPERRKLLSTSGPMEVDEGGIPLSFAIGPGMEEVYGRQEVCISLQLGLLHPRGCVLGPSIAAVSLVLADGELLPAAAATPYPEDFGEALPCNL